MGTRKLIIGCGYLGRRVARRWLQQGDTVFALTRSADRAHEFRLLGIEPVLGDVTEPASIGDLPEVGTILYAVGLDRSTGHSQRAVSVAGLGNVLDRVAGKTDRFVYISSASVYGQNRGEWVDESSECRPDSANGQVCSDAEALLRDRAPTANVLRLAGIYGPGRLVARVEALRAGLVVEGNPDAWLNLIHVDDAVAAIVACERRDVPGSTLLVCDDHPCRRRDYYLQLAWLVGAPPPRFGLAGDGVASAESDDGGGAKDTSARSAPALGHTFESARAAKPAGLNKRCSNRRLREQLQVALRFPRINIGLPNALTTPTGGLSSSR